jgi:hypothetical protein
MPEDQTPRREPRGGEQDVPPSGCIGSSDACCAREHDSRGADRSAGDWDRELGGATDGYTVYSAADPGL